jgi:hypothetical protein
MKVSRKRLGFCIIDKKQYEAIFIQMIQDLYYEKLKLKDDLILNRIKKEEEKGIWMVLSELIDREDNIYGISYVVYRYILVKARRQFMKLW